MNEQDPMFFILFVFLAEFMSLRSAIFTIGLFLVLSCFKLSYACINNLRQRQSNKPRHKQIQSKIASFYYGKRVQVLSYLGVI